MRERGDTARYWGHPGNYAQKVGVFAPLPGRQIFLGAAQEFSILNVEGRKFLVPGASLSQNIQ
jgi:hypothetical protein